MKNINGECAHPSKARGTKAVDGRRYCCAKVASEANAKTIKQDNKKEN